MNNVQPTPLSVHVIVARGVDVPSCITAPKHLNGELEDHYGSDLDEAWKEEENHFCFTPDHFESYARPARDLAKPANGAAGKYRAALPGTARETSAATDIVRFNVATMRIEKQFVQMPSPCVYFCYRFTEAGHVDGFSPLLVIAERQGEQDYFVRIVAIRQDSDNRIHGWSQEELQLLAVQFGGQHFAHDTRKPEHALFA